MRTPSASSIEDQVRPFLRRQGFADSTPLEAVRGGANNRVFHLEERGRDCLLKVYYRDATDPRDRFAAEHGFYTLASQGGIRSIPQPLAWDSDRRLGLFEFIPGRKLRPEEITAAVLDQTLHFVLELARLRGTLAAASLPNASEACFSIEEHLACVQRRVERLARFQPATALEEKASRFVRDQLSPAWRETFATISRECLAAGFPATQLLPPADRCPSPSDFGFHNALLTASGELKFFDFEYSGWDDPAKLVCDFFCQPQIPVPWSFHDRCVGSLATGLAADSHFTFRARILQDAYSLKWCCIMLNDFIRGDRERREFASEFEETEERKARQLAKAEQCLEGLLERRSS